MARKAVVLNIQGIKCDNPDCGYRDDTVDFKDYKIRAGKPRNSFRG